MVEVNIVFADRHRLKREARTVLVMVGMYCHDHHRSTGLCSDCRMLADYTLQRLDKCLFEERKTVCALCPVHCFKPELREQIRDVMRYAGPKMALRHPVMAVRHIIDRQRKKPLG